MPKKLKSDFTNSQLDLFRADMVEAIHPVRTHRDGCCCCPLVLHLSESLPSEPRSRAEPPLLLSYHDCPPRQQEWILFATSAAEGARERPSTAISRRRLPFSCIRSGSSSIQPNWKEVDKGILVRLHHGIWHVCLLFPISCHLCTMEDSLRDTIVFWHNRRDTAVSLQRFMEISLSRAAGSVGLKFELSQRKYLRRRISGVVACWKKHCSALMAGLVWNPFS